MAYVTKKSLEETSQQSSLSTREKHLVGLAVTLTQGCTKCTSRRFQEALDSGITQKEIEDLTDLVALTNAGVILRTALTSMEINDNNNTCNDDICSQK